MPAAGVRSLPLVRTDCYPVMLGRHDPVDRRTRSLLVTWIHAREETIAMAKKKAAPKVAKNSRPKGAVVKGKALKTTPGTKRSKPRRDDDTPAINKEPVEIKDGERIVFRLDRADIADDTITEIDIQPDEDEPVDVRIPTWFWYRPSSSTSNDAIDIYTIAKAKVDGSDDSFRGIASGKLTITIRPKTLASEPPTFSYQVKFSN